MIVSPVDTNLRITALNELTPQAAYLIEEHGWVQDQMMGEEGELCIVSACHGAAHSINTPGLSHVLREVLDELGHAEEWNDMPGQSDTAVIGYLSTLKITEEALELTFGPQWGLVCHLAEFFAKMSYEEMSEWASTQNDIPNYALLQHLDDQEEPDRREIRARGAVCAAASERAIEFNLNPMGPSVALLTSKVIRPTLRS